MKVTNDLTVLIDNLKKINTLDTTPEIILPKNLKPLEPSDVLKRLRNFIADLIFHIESMGIFGGYKASIAAMIQIERLSKYCDDVNLSLILKYAMTTIGCVKFQFAKAMQDYTGLDRILRFSSSKILKLFKILEEFKTRSKEELCALIFVKRRWTAKVIHHVLESYKEVCPKFDHIKSNFIVGNANNPYSNTRENLFLTKKNREVLDSFVNKEINVLVSSNVLEEGVDIPKCTLVVKFDKAEEYRSYIQSKGRARHRSSLYVTIVEKAHLGKFRDKYEEFQQIENLLNEVGTHLCIGNIGNYLLQKY